MITAAPRPVATRTMTEATGQPVPELYGLVLAGGRSRRFGSDKASLEIEGQTLLARTAALLKPHVRQVFVSVRPDQTNDALRTGFQLIADQRQDAGPAAGLLAAHDHLTDAAWLIVACDLPRLNQPAIERLVRERDHTRAATAFRSPVDDLPEPLCAIYEPATLARFRRQADAGGGLSPKDLLLGVDVRLIDAPAGEVLSNVNTPADLERLQDR